MSHAMMSLVRVFIAEYFSNLLAATELLAALRSAGENLREHGLQICIEFTQHSWDNHKHMGQPWAQVRSRRINVFYGNHAKLFQRVFGLFE
jgi:hypothetical protein